MSSYFDEHNCHSTNDGNESLDLLLLARILLRNESIAEIDEDIDLDKLEGPPASKKVVQELPRKTVKDTTEGKHSCPICLMRCEENMVLIEFPCLHLFHEDCIIPWLNKTNSCPVCRHELPTDNPEYEELRLRKARENGRVHRVESLHSAMFS